MTPAEGNARDGRAWRRFATMALVALGCLGLALTNPTLWLNRSLLDTDGYVETVADIPSDPAVADALGSYLVAEVIEETDAEDAVSGALGERLGPRSDGISRLLASTVEVTTARAASRIIAGEEFAVLWQAANRRAHASGLAVITGERRGRAAEIDLREAVERVAARLEETAGVTLVVDDDVGTLEAFDEDTLGPARRGVSALRSARWLLPLATLALFAAALVVSRRRWRTGMHIGLGIITVVLVTAVALRLARREIVEEATTDNLPADAADSIWESVTAGLYSQTWLLLVAGVVVTSVGALWGTDGGERVRGRLARRSEGSGPLVDFISRNAGGAQLAVIAAGLVLLLVLPAPGLPVVLLVTAAVIAGVAVIRSLARGRPAADGDST